MFLEILDKLIEEKKINKSVLAKESGIPYTTIDGFYKKGWENVKLSTLLKLAAYFEVSVDYLVSGEGKRTVAKAKKEAGDDGEKCEKYTEKEKKVVAAYREGGEKRELIDRVVNGEKLVSVTEEPKKEEAAPVRKRRKDDFIIF